MKDNLCKKQEVLAIIPARSGSKSVKDKNIRLMDGNPLLSYSIKHALQSKKISRTIVSTDSTKYAQIAKQYGAEVPFIRPSEISKDSSLDIEVFEHALKYLKEKEGYVPDIVVQLRPTYPVRKIEDINNMISILENDNRIDSVRCIVPVKEIPYKMWKKEENGIIVPLLKDIHEAYNMPRQELPKVYYQNACIDVVRERVISQLHSMSGEHIVGYEMNYNFDIDTEEDFKRAEEFLKLQTTPHTYVFDIDGVIAQLESRLQYDRSLPNEKMIKIINFLYNSGNKIILYTARGYKTGIDWEKTTAEQLMRWGVNYHELKMGKPDADFYIDDKMLSLEVLNNYFGTVDNL